MGGGGIRLGGVFALSKSVYRKDMFVATIMLNESYEQLYRFEK